jgi:sterol desaturase/sphingolipid hydroxylase (fatty acid hydroxylase superfamily)
LVHWIEHLPKNHITMKLPYMKWLREHHIVHHSRLKDEANFGIVEPSWDYIFGTKK